MKTINISIAIIFVIFIIAIIIIFVIAISENRNRSTVTSISGPSGPVLSPTTNPQSNEIVVSGQPGSRIQLPPITSRGLNVNVTSPSLLVTVPPSNPPSGTTITVRNNSGGPVGVEAGTGVVFFVTLSPLLPPGPTPSIPINPGSQVTLTSTGNNRYVLRS